MWLRFNLVKTKTDLNRLSSIYDNRYLESLGDYKVIKVEYINSKKISKPVGAIVFRQDFDYKLQKYIYISSIRISNEFRNLGIGSILLKKVEEYAISIGITKLKLIPVGDYIKLNHFYQKKNGFRETKDKFYVKKKLYYLRRKCKLPHFETFSYIKDHFQLK